MIWKNYIDAGTRITIVIDNGDGIRNGKTPIMYKGIQVGLVENIYIKNDDVSKLELTALIDKQATEGITREGNKFWKVEPKISITEVSGLNTIVSGIYIAVMPAVKTKDELYSLPFQDHFIALSSPPVDVFDPGLSIVVSTRDLGDMAIGAPVLYNKQAIGKVEDKKLSADKQSVDLYLRINAKYMELVHSKSVFYKADALEVKASLSGFKMNIGSFASFIAGGIVMYNDEESLESSLAVERTHFSLYGNYEEVMLSEDEIVLIMDKNNNLKPDESKLFYKGVDAGIVKKLKYDATKNHTLVTIKLHKAFRRFANEKAYFWVVEPRFEFDRIEGLDAIVKGNYINFVSTDLNAKIKTNFVLHDEGPSKEGVHITVTADDIGSLKDGTGISYHGVDIGTVGHYRINKDKKSFSVDLIIEPRYSSLINTSSLFYNKSGIEVSVGISGVNVHAGTLENIARGGIAVITPDFKADKSLKKVFRLYASYEDLSEHEYITKKGIFITLLADKLGSLKKGSPIYYRQINVGKILSYRWDQEIKKIVLKAFIIDEYAKEGHDNSLFYNASGIDGKFDFSGLEINTESIETIVSGGLAFYTPSSQDAKLARNHEQFVLYDTKTKAMNKYTDVTLHSKDSYGLIAGNIVMYKSVVIGHVENVRLVEEGVDLDLKVDSRYAYLMKEDTLFWTESFQMSLQGIENFSAALKGSFIMLQPGISQKDEHYFQMISKAPSPYLNEKGLRVTVRAQRLGGIKEKTPVFYRQIKIGTVVQYTLNDDATGVDVELFIEPCFAHLIRENSYFYNASGIGMEIGLFSAKVKTETLESIITGGIAIMTPDDFGDKAKDEHLFKLHEDFDEDALKWTPKLRSNDTACQETL